MATTKGKNKPGTEVTAPKRTALANAAPMGKGFEEADADAFAIPFLAMLQKGTPQADPDDPAYIKGAKAGMFMNTVTLELYTEVEIIPCAYQRRFNRWAPRDSGGGFKGTFMPSAVPGLEASGKISMSEEGRWYFSLPDGSINEKKCDILTDTRMHFCQQVDDGRLVPVLVSLSRTQLKKSKNWMALMQMKGGNMFDHAYTCTSKLEENDKGKWMGWVIGFEREAEEAERAACDAFHDSVTSGLVKVKMDSAADE